MSRAYARAPKGRRAYSSTPHHPGERVNLIAALSTSGIQAPWLVTGGSVDTRAFVTYVEHVLGPTLRPGQIVVLDNYSIHTAAEVRDLIAARGCTLLFLPTSNGQSPALVGLVPYSPDLNPIENAFAKLKALLRQARAATFDALSLAIKHACRAISLQDAKAFFNHCGYTAQYFC